MEHKKLIIFVMLFSIALVSASSPSLGTFKQSQAIELKQSCVINGTFCDTCRISSVDYPNGSRAIEDKTMTKGSVDFYYELGSAYTEPLGTYRVNGYCDFGSVRRTFVYVLIVTPSGQSGTSNIVFIVILLVLLYVLTLVFFLQRRIELAPFVALCGMTLGTLGLYIIRQGLIVYRDWFTNSVAYVTIGVGFGLGLWSLIEWIEDNI